MPRFLCYCPDLPDNLDQRMSVRPAHLERVGKEKEEGSMSTSPVKIPFGVGLMRPRPGTAARDKQLPEGQPNIAGSCMIYVMPSLDEVWKRLKEDVYWTANVWDKDRLIVEELLD